MPKHFVGYLKRGNINNKLNVSLDHDVTFKVNSNHIWVKPLSYGHHVMGATVHL